jgi:hypothetical protein
VRLESLRRLHLAAQAEASVFLIVKYRVCEQARPDRTGLKLKKNHLLFSTNYLEVTMPNQYSKEQLAVAKQIFERARDLMPKGPVFIGEEHHRAQPRGLVGNLINKCRVQRLYLEIPGDLNIEMLNMMSYAESVGAMKKSSEKTTLSPYTTKFNEDKKRKPASSGGAASDSNTAAGATLDKNKNIAEWIREVQQASPTGRANLRDNPIWVENIKCGLDSHFDVGKNAVTLSRLIEHAVANGVEVRFFDLLSWNKLDSARQKHMSDTLQKENIAHGDLILVGHHHCDAKVNFHLGKDENTIQAIHEEPAGDAR